MKAISKQQRDAFFTNFRHEAWHLEMRDIYATSIEKDKFRRHLAGEPVDPEEQQRWWRPWVELMQANVAAGKSVRRLRVISEPVSDYIRFEWMDSNQLIKAGEQLRWLPRSKASELLLPGNDLWLFDRETVVFTLFAGNGKVVGYDLCTNERIVAQCLESFEAAWALGISHDHYQPT